MFSITIERADGERLTLTQCESAYMVKYTGLSPVAATINTSKRSIGVQRNGTHVGGRNIVLTVYIRGNVEANRIRLYQFLAPNSVVKLHYANETRRICVEGCVESHVCDQFSAKCFAQISIMCESPYLSGAEAIVQEITSIVDAFEFPFTIEAEGIEFSTIDGSGYVNAQNTGDVTTGAIFRVFAHAAVVNPNIFNAVTNEYFKYSGTLEAGDTLTINTNSGEKRLTVTDISGVVTNALYRKAEGSTWLQLNVGDNYLTYSADSGIESMSVSVEYNNLFVGV